MCAFASGFRAVTVTPRGGRVRFCFDRRQDRPVDVDVFQVSAGRRVLSERLIARFRNRTRAFTWNGRERPSGTAVRSGALFVRYTMRLAGGEKDVRRKVLEKRGGRYRQERDFYRREGCGLLRSYKLERPVFGGPRRRSLGVAFRLTDPARVTIRVLRGKRTVATLMRDRAHGGRAHPPGPAERARAAARRLPRRHDGDARRARHPIHAPRAEALARASSRRRAQAR